MSKNPIGGTRGQLTYHEGVKLTTPNNFVALIDFKYIRLIAISV